MYIGKRFYGQ